MKNLLTALCALAAILGLSSGCLKDLDRGYDGQSQGRYQQRSGTESKGGGQNQGRPERRVQAESRGGRGGDRQYEQKDDSAPTLARQVLDIVNQERQRNGAPGLSWDNTLAQIAQTRAKEISGHFSHTRPNGTNWDSLLKDYQVGWSRNGENIAYGQQSAQAVMNTWMNSSGHRANILDSGFTRLGVGMYSDGSGQPYWVQIFIRP